MKEERDRGQKRRARTSVYLYNDVVTTSFLIDERRLRARSHSHLVRKTIHFMEDDLDLYMLEINKKEKKEKP